MKQTVKKVLSNKNKFFLKEVKNCFFVLFQMTLMPNRLLNPVPLFITHGKLVRLSILTAYEPA